jgi:general secretion pathway protein D
LSKAELYQTFLSVLRVHGYSAVEAGSAIRIVPEAKAASDGAIGLGAALGDDMVTRVVELKHVSPGELVQVLAPLKGASAQIIPHAGSSSLLVADRASNVNRMLEIIRRIDQAAQSDIEMVALNNANASEIVRTINGMSSDNSANRLVADERTNSVLMSGDRNRRLKLRGLIASLDVPLSGSDSMEVIYLRYAEADQLVPILEGVLRGSKGPGGAPLPGASPAGLGAPAPAAQLGSSTVIQAHKETNSLVITAPPAVLRELKSLVRQLDVRRAQVLIEAVIAEVSDDQAKRLGIQWQGSDYDQEGVIGGTNFPGAGTPGIIGAAAGLSGLSNSSGLNLGYIDGTVTLPGSDTPIIKLGALATALASNGDGNILSQPSTIALDHQKATLSVGQEVPFLTGAYQTQAATGGGQGGLVNPFQTVERKEVGLKLTVTPHINEGDSVRMEVDLEVSSLAGNVPGAADLITNTRKLITQAIVRDGGMLVLGGLSSDSLEQGESRVPGLGRIPVLGNLFKSRRTEVKKRNLLVFIKPTIARDAMTEDMITFGKYNQIRDMQIQSRENASALTPKESVPVMPNLQEYLKAPLNEPLRSPPTVPKAPN